MFSLIKSILLIATFALSACASLDGHKVTVDANGKVKVTNVKGLPITVQRPNRALFVVTKSVFAVSRTSFDPDTGAVRASVPSADEIQVSITDEPILLGPTELYTIDPKRPAAGTIDYAIALENGYPTSITGKLDDQTIAQVRQLITEAIDKIASFSGVGVPTPQSGETVTRTLKTQELVLVIFNLETGVLEIKPVQ